MYSQILILKVCEFLAKNAIVPYHVAKNYPVESLAGKKTKTTFQVNPNQGAWL